MSLLNILIPMAREVNSMTAEEREKELKNLKTQHDIETELNGRESINTQLKALMLIQKDLEDDRQ